MVARTVRLGAGTTQEAVRRHNLSLVLSYLHHEGQLSRVELTTRLGLNRSTIGALVGELVGLGVAVEAAPSDSAPKRSGAGRPSLDVRPASSAVYVMAVDIAVQRLRVARVGLGGQVLQQAFRSTTERPRPTEIATLIARLVRQLTPTGSQALNMGLGVAVPGVVRQHDGVVRFAPNLKWRDVPLGALITERLGSDLPVRLANDAHLGVRAEVARGAAIGGTNVVFLMADIGLGGGVLVDGRPLRGVGGYAGEWGHLQVNSRGRVCRCGSVGCWETEVCAPAVARALQVPAAEVAASLERLARRKKSSRKLQQVGRYLGLGLGDVVNVLNPEVIILGGVLAQLLEIMPEAIREAMAEASLTASREHIRITTPGLGVDSVLLGAGEWAFAELLADPAGAVAVARSAAEVPPVWAEPQEPNGAVIDLRELPIVEAVE